MRETIDHTLPRFWRGLPVLLLVTAPWVVAVLLTAGVTVAAAGPLVLLVPLVAAATAGPAWQLVTDVAAALLRDEPVPVRRLPGLAGRAVGRGLRRAVPLALAGLLVLATLLATAQTGGGWLRVSLAANLVALGITAVVAPFAYAAPAPAGAVAAWRHGAAVAAANPGYVVTLLGFVAAAGGFAWVLGPPLLCLMPPVVATATVAVTRTTLGRASLSVAS